VNSRAYIDQLFEAPDFEDLYHGTKASFSAFDLKYAGQTDPGLVGPAVYLTPSQDQAQAFANSPHYGKGTAPRVIKASVSLKNPAVVQDGTLPDGRTLTQAHPQGITRASGRALQRHLLRKGHDGVVFKLGDDVVQVAVFDPRIVRVEP
jgi:hypothetical protein